MDSIEQQKRQAMAEFRRAESSSRRSRHAFLSVLLLLLFCLLVSLPSWDQDLSLLLTGLPDCFWVVDRKAMFLLCNFILVVLAMDSGLVASFMPEKEPCDEFSVREKSHWRKEEVSSTVDSGSGWPLPVPTVEKGSKPKEAATAEEEVKEQEQEQEEQRQQQEQQHQLLQNQQQQEQQHQLLQNQQQQLQRQQEEEEEEGEEEEEEGVEEDLYPDMDELNKKFEDFIEKVKMERKLEALQLVWV